MGVRTFMVEPFVAGVDESGNDVIRWRRPDDTLYSYTSPSQAGPGAMWDADWWHEIPGMCGPDGLALVVNCPDGFSWHIDGRANNCDMPCGNCGVPYKDHPAWGGPDSGTCSYTEAHPHKCWTRTGTPPVITVGKQYGPTCGAGAGSIITGGPNPYHGLLINGEFT